MRIHICPLLMLVVLSIHILILHTIPDAFGQDQSTGSQPCAPDAVILAPNGAECFQTQRITLDGTSSIACVNPKCSCIDRLRYSWEILDAPAGVVFENGETTTDRAKPSVYCADTGGNYSFHVSLTVTNSDNQIDSAQIALAVTQYLAKIQFESVSLVVEESEKSKSVGIELVSNVPVPTPWDLFFTLSARNASTAELDVDCSVKLGQYKIPSGSAAGTVVRVFIEPKDDQISEGIETMNLHLSGVAGAGLSISTNSHFRWLIRDNDGGLLGVGNNYEHVVKCNPETGEAPRLGGWDTESFGIFQASAYVPETDVIYAWKWNWDLIVVDPLSGFSAPIAIPGMPQIWGMEYNTIDHKIYGVSAGNGLYVIDPVQRTCETVGTLSYDQFSGLAFNSADGMLYAVTLSDRELIRINPQKAECTLITTFTNLLYSSLAYNPLTNKLYTNHYYNGYTHLKSVNPATGQTTSVGTLPGSMPALHFDFSRQMLCGAYVDGSFVWLETNSTIIADRRVVGVNPKDLDWDARSKRIMAISEKAELYEIDPDTGIGTTTNAVFQSSPDYTLTSSLTYDQSADRWLTILYNHDAYYDSFFPASEGSQFPSGIGPRALTWNPKAEFAYATKYNGGNCELFTVDPVTQAVSYVAPIEGCNSHLETLVYRPKTGTLYSVFNSTVYPGNTLLQELDPVTGLATPVGQSEYTDVLGLAVDPDSDTMYAVVSDDRDQVYRLDPDTGEYGAITGHLGFDEEYDAIEYDRNNDVAYLFSMTGVFYHLNPRTGAYTKRIPTSLQNVRALLMDTSTQTLYASRNSQLYVVDPDTGNATQILTYTPSITITGLTYDEASSTVYATNGATLYRLDVSNGTLDEIGPAGANQIGDLAWSPSEGKLYASTNYSLLYTLDPNTGAILTTERTSAPMRGLTAMK